MEKSPRTLLSILQILLVLFTQTTKQFFFAKSAPIEMENLYLLSKGASDSSLVFWLVLIDVGILRFPTVFFSRAPSIMRKNNVPEREELITDILVYTTTGEKYGNSFSDCLSEQNRDEQSEKESLLKKRGNQFSKAKEEAEKLLGYEIIVEFHDIKRYYLNSKKRKRCERPGILDALFTVPTTAFYMLFTGEKLFNIDSKGSKAGILAFGTACGIAAGVTYYLFRVPRSVGRIAVLQEAWEKEGFSKINKKAYNKAKFKAWVAAITMFTFSFYGGFHTLNRAFGNNTTAEIFSLILTTIASASAGHTFYRNMLTCLMARYIDYNKIEGAKKIQAEKQKQGYCTKFLIGLMWFIGGASALADGIPSAMSTMFSLMYVLNKVHYHPSRFEWPVGIMLGVSALLYIVPFERSLLFTVKDCVKNIEKTLTPKEENNEEEALAPVV